jgi:hypothetical protein
MTIELTWPDLLIEDPTPAQVDAWLSPWAWLVKGKVQPLFLSRFGDWFLRRPDGSTQRLDVLAGTLTTLAATPAAFEAMLNDPQWQDEQLLRRLVRRLHEQGKIPGPGEGYAFTPHPAFTGRFEPADATVMEMGAWQAASAQIFEGAAGADPAG